jgi:hypothetical protein
VTGWAGPPVSACWWHRQAREGFEAAFFRAVPGADGVRAAPGAGGWLIEGTTAASEDGQAWTVAYRIEVDASWATRLVSVRSQVAGGPRELELRADGAGHWRADGEPAPWLDGCLDVDLESSALTNAFPVHRLGLAVGGQASAPAAYVRALDLGVDRLEQHYERIADAQGHQRYRYAAPAFGFTAELVYDEAGLVLEYPGIARRAG